MSIDHDGLAWDELACNLRAGMARKRLTTRDLEAEWGISKSTVSRVRNGKPVSAYATIAMCVVAEIDPVWLLMDLEKGKNP